MKQLKNKVISIIGNILFILLIVAILGGAFWFANNKSNEKSVFGYRFYHVLTPSMTPTIPVGSMVLVKMIEPIELKDGDIITYSTSMDGSLVVTHRINRIIELEEHLMFVTKGDANPVEDLNPILPSQVIGKVNLIIPYLGSIMAYIQGNLFLVITTVIALIMIFELISYIIKNSKKNRE